MTNYNIIQLCATLLINVPVSFDSLFRQQINSKKTPSKEYTNNSTSYKEYTNSTTPHKEYTNNTTPYKEYTNNTTPYKEYTNNATPYKEYINNSTPYKEYTNNTTPSKVEVVDLESDDEDNAPIHPGSAAARYICGGLQICGAIS